MRILVTNDDGIGRPGLLALVQVLVGSGHEVRAFAPHQEFSGSSASLGTVVRDARIQTRGVSLAGLPQVPALAVEAPPALAVRAACTGAFGWVPGLVVSGINPGFNTGRLVLHSGTLGAALTAASLNVTGIAVSTSGEDPLGFATAATLASWLTDSLPRELPAIAFNLNVPPRPVDALAGVAVATLSEVSISDVSFETGPESLRVHRGRNPPPFEHGSDSDLLSRGWAALSAVSPPGTQAPAPTAVSAVATDLHRRWTERLVS